MALLPNRHRFAESIQKLRRLISDDLSWQHRQLSQYEAKSKNLLAGIFEAAELKSGIAGFRVDLKKLGALRRNSSFF
jgi:hypothetical protein